MINNLVYQMYMVVWGMSKSLSSSTNNTEMGVFRD